MKLYIKHMVSYRCIMLVKAELEKLGIQFEKVNLGMADLSEPLSEERRQALKISLAESGLELYENKKSIITEKIKAAIHEMIFQLDEMPRLNYSEYLSEKLSYDYTFMANTFSQLKGITIQQYIVVTKIEKVKELLVNDDLSLSEISYKLNYSSVAHLSNQFKKHTGLTPSCYKQLMVESTNDSRLA